MHHNLMFWGVRAFAPVAVAALLAAPRVEATPLHAFGCVGADCIAGSGPNELVKAPSGAIYGTANGGGANGRGTIFKLTPNGGSYDYQLLYSFCSQQPSCADGAGPRTELTVDSQDRVYGTTQFGGGHDDGVAFRFDPATSEFTIMHSFCSAPSCADGSTPIGNSGSHARLTYEGQESGAFYNGASPLYGTTISGGAAGSGVVYKLLPTPNGRRWREAVIHSFCTEGNGCPNGYAPGYLGFDGKGRLIGTANGGTGEAGILYRMTTRGRETVLYNFCAGGEPCTDGRGPGAFALNSKGGIVGVTAKGGVGDDQASYNFGRLYEYARGGTVTVNDFCAEYDDIGHCEDGERPLGGLSQANGVIYGTTENGGTDPSDGGTIYRLKGNRYKTIASFCAASDCTDGYTPTSGVVIDDAGNIIGTTSSGGANGSGTVFEFSP